MADKQTKTIPVGFLMRKTRRLSKETVVEKLKELGSDISVFTLRNYEAGETDMPISILINLSKIYKCSFYDLLGYHYNMENKLPMSNYDTFTLTSKHQLVSKNNADAPYDYMTNIASNTYDYAHAILDFDDPNTNLPKGTRLIYKRRKNFDIRVNEESDLFLITKSSEIKGVRYSKSFFTKAKLVAISEKPKLVQYYENGKVEHMSLKYFTSIMDGVVVQIVMDLQTKNTEIEKKQTSVGCLYW